MIDIRKHIINRLMTAVNEPDMILIYPHIGADGDALGSSLALLLVFDKLKIKAKLLIDEPVSPKLRFLPHWEKALVFEEKMADSLIDTQSMAVAVDCADAERVGRRRLVYEKASHQIVLDHHVSSGKSDSLRLIDANAAAAAEIIVDLIKDLETQYEIELMDRDIATLLMAALVSDTGRFVYSNTTARSFSTAAWLLQYDIDLRNITYNLFDITSQTKIKLTGRIFSDANFFCEGRIAVAKIDPALLLEYGATEHDLDGIVSQLNNVKGVEVSFVLRQLDDDKIRINIRSGDKFNASLFAREYGGGGHPKAAGMTLNKIDLQLAEKQLIEHALRYLS